jgi:tRNA(Ile)-lysidine synthase
MPVLDSAPEALRPPPGGWLSVAQAAFDRRLDASSGAPLAVAFSGGGDSLALLLAAKAWADAAGRQVLVLTVDHRLQVHSETWTAQARSTARRLGADFRACPWEGPKPRTGLPAAARRARHALLAEAAREAGARVILMGHTLDDELEATLMREEGSTLGRLREWSPSPVWPQGRALFLLRPLLGIRRAALREGLRSSGLSWIEDPANDDPRFARARARARLADRASTSTTGLDRRLDEELAGLARRAGVDRFGVVRIDRGALAGAADDVGRRLLSIACLCASGGERTPRADRLARLLGAVAGPDDFAATLAGARIEGTGRSVLVMRDAGETSRGGLAPLHLGPHGAAVWDGRFRIETDRGDAQVRPLKGLAARLGARERAVLTAAPPAARPGLPAITIDGENVTCPILAEGSGLHVRCLVRGRFAAAVGEIGSERELQAWTDGEPAKGALS